GDTGGSVAAYYRPVDKRPTGQRTDGRLPGAGSSGAGSSGGRFGRSDAIPRGGGFLRRAAVDFAAVPTEGAVAIYQQCERTRPRDHQGGTGAPTAAEPPAVIQGHTLPST